MDRSFAFRRLLVSRWIPLLGLTLPAVAAGLPACGGNVVVDATAANGGGGSGSGGNGGTAGNVQVGGSGGNGGFGAGQQGGFGGSGGLGGFGPGTTLECIDPIPSNPGETYCPDTDEAYQYVNTGECGWIQSGPAVQDEQCCYVVVDQECGKVGRPYLVDGRAHTAAIEPGATGWLGDEGRCPEVAALTTSQRAALAEAWARDGLMEHASVASFGRFALELLAAGAPAALVADAHRAALDEVRHAKLCLSLASAYSGDSIVPGPFDFGRGVAIESNLPGIAARTFLEGCVGETLAAVQAVEQLAAATDPAVRAVLEIIAEDEARHAELAWRTVAWALKSGGEPVRAALREALGRVTISAGDGAADATLRAHGRLDGVSTRAAMERALREVVLPCAQRLLAEAGTRIESIGEGAVMASA